MYQPELISTHTLVEQFRQTCSEQITLIIISLLKMKTHNVQVRVLAQWLRCGVMWSLKESLLV